MSARSRNNAFVGEQRGKLLINIHGQYETQRQRKRNTAEEVERRAYTSLRKRVPSSKKLRAGRNKENDHQNNSKKGRSSSIKKKREEILEIPVLPEITNDDPKFKDAREIFFYDIPKYWSEEDVRTNLMKIGQVMRIQIRGQYKYKTVKAKISLNENFERTLRKGISVFALTKLSLDVRNRKTIYKEGKKLNKEKKVIKKSGKGESALSYETNVGPESKETSNEPLTPMTPPDRIYRELGNFASRKESLTHPSKEEAFHQKKELPNDDSDSEESVISYREAQARERSRKKTPKNKQWSI
ncbi:unnamed protein product [Rhizophagus irregularis]|nr:unnamed protein product [Rhizophagus irregularis]